MEYQTASSEIQYKDVTEQYFDKNYPYEMFKCYHGGTCIGMIAWEEQYETYMFFSTSSQIGLAYNGLMNIAERIFTLMASRRLN